MKEENYFLHLGLHVLPDLLTFSLVFFIFASKYFSHVNTDPNSNVMLSANHSTSTCYVEIAAQQHNPNWTDRLRQSLLRNIVIYRVDMCLNIHSVVSLNTLGSILDILSQPKLYGNINSNSRRSNPALELDITVPKYPGIEQDMQRVFQRTNVNLEDVAPYIQKLTWQGIFADFVFTRPPYCTISEMTFQREKDATTFSSLKELRLLDCTVDPRLLVNILAQCPVLTILEVQTVGSALNESSSENAEDLAYARLDDTSSNLDLVHHFQNSHRLSHSRHSSAT